LTQDDVEGHRQPVRSAILATARFLVALNCMQYYTLCELYSCRWESCFEEIAVESLLWQQTKEWLWIISQVLTFSHVTSVQSIVISARGKR